MSRPIRAGIYTRISLASLGDNTKVDDQERICRRLAAQLGWEVQPDVGHPHHNGVYCDHSKSAWQKNRKRPAWDQMLRDVDAGRINGIIVYHGDRLVRRPEDLTDLIRLADNKGVRLANPTGTYNLDKSRLEPWIRAAFAEEESQRHSERRKDQYERWRREGRTRPGGRGGRAFGFGTDGVTHTPPIWYVIATREPGPTEADIVREVAHRILAGEPAGEIARDLTGRGIRTPTGGPFSHHTLRKMLVRPRYAGLMPDGKHPAAWQPILDRETWETVRMALAAKAAGYSFATNTRRYLLSGIARCGICGEGLTVNNREKEGRPSWYRCTSRECRKVYRDQPNLDEYVITRTLAKLNDPRNPPGRMAENIALAPEFAALTRQRKQVAAAIANPSKDPDLGALLQRRDWIDGRLAQLRELAAGNASARLLGGHTGLTREQWDALPLATRRALVGACFTVTVLPASRRGPGFRTEDIDLTPPRS